jgi:hypothetical protein
MNRGRSPAGTNHQTEDHIRYSSLIKLGDGRNFTVPLSKKAARRM